MFFVIFLVFELIFDGIVIFNFFVILVFIVNDILFKVVIGIFEGFLFFKILIVLNFVFLFNL